MRVTRPVCSNLRSRQGFSLLALIAAAATLVSVILVGPGVAMASALPVPDQTPATQTATADPSGSPSSSESSSPLTSPAPSESPSASGTPAKSAGSSRSTGSSESPSGRSSGCGGKLAFGEIVVCPSISGDEQHVYTVTSTVDSDTLITQLTRGSGDYLSGWVTTSDGEFVCPLTLDAGTCQLGAAGTYTITVSLYFGGSGNYSLAVESMRTPSSCSKLPEVFFSFDSAGRTATLPAGAAAHCYFFEQPVGSVLHLADPGGAGDVQGPILDAQYQPLCQLRYTTECTLIQPGPYRLFLHESYGNEATYTLRMPRISHSVGCQVVPLASFGDPGNAAGTGTLVENEQVTCHALTAAAADTVAARISPDQLLWWTIYDADGQKVCDKYSAARYCQLPKAGAYTLLVQNQDNSGNKTKYEVAVATLSQTGGLP